MRQALGKLVNSPSSEPTITVPAASRSACSTSARRPPATSYLRELPLEQALARYVEHLRRLTVALGVPEKYHATITWTYVIALHDAMVGGPGLEFDDLLRARPDLLDHDAGVLARHYTRDELDEPRARERFVLPRSRGVAPR